MNPQAIRVVALGTLRGPRVHWNPVVPSNGVTNLYLVTFSPYKSSTPGNNIWGCGCQRTQICSLTMLHISHPYSYTSFLICLFLLPCRIHLLWMRSRNPTAQNRPNSLCSRNYCWHTDPWCLENGNLYRIESLHKVPHVWSTYVHELTTYYHIQVDKEVW